MSQAHRRALCGTHGSLRMMHGGGSARSCCAFTHRVAFEEGSGPRVLLKSGPGNRGRSACGPTHVARLEFPRDTGLILRCPGKAWNPFQTTQGNRLSCRDQEGRRGSEEAVPGPLVFPSREPGVSGDCWGSQESCRATVGFLTRYNEELIEPLVQCQVSQVSMRVARGSVSWLSSHGRGIVIQKPPRRES